MCLVRQTAYVRKEHELTTITAKVAAEMEAAEQDVHVRLSSHT